jgi:hypothetical protein
MWGDPETHGTIIFKSYEHHNSRKAPNLGLEDRSGEILGIIKDECK